MMRSFDFAAGREQHLAVARRELRFAAADRMRSYSQAARERDGCRVNRLMSGVSREIEHRDCEDEPEQRRDRGPRSDSEKNPQLATPLS